MPTYESIRYKITGDNISGVLQLIVGAYFGSRGAEKVFGNKLHK